MIQVERNRAFKLSVIMTSSSDFVTPVTGLASAGVRLYTKRETQASVQAYPPGSNWQECGHGLYQVNFGSGFAADLGRFDVVVTGAAVLPFYGQCQVVGALPGQINAALDVVTGQLPQPLVPAHASYDGATLGLSFFLERGAPVTSPVSGEFHLYDQLGTQLASGASSVDDPRGVFRFTRNLNLADDTTPYVDCTVKDALGRETTRTGLPVVGG